MLGIKIVLNTFTVLLVVCALATVWCEKPACGVFVAKLFATMCIVTAVITSRETAKL